ncbi:MAG: threonylcarbamoyl-AMP synthase [Deltaproteobacteria bacterium]|nr:MAG: threonylcarbamoyl-AMP synthase [Deltaproteobacteria bacterium]
MREVLKIDRQRPDESVIAEASSILRAGGVVAYPTETFYGLGADGQIEDAIKKIFLIKGRNFKNPISVIIGNANDVRGLVEEIPEFALHLMEKFWPGALTIIFKASSDVSPLLTAGTGKIGIRLSSHPVATALANKLGHPITATSANLSGKHECTSADEVIQGIGDQIDAVMDGGQTPGGSGSTIIDVTTDPPVILREGIIPKHKLTYSAFL